MQHIWGLGNFISGIKEKVRLLGGFINCDLDLTSFMEFRLEEERINPFVMLLLLNSPTKYEVLDKLRNEFSEEINKSNSSKEKVEDKKTYNLTPFSLLGFIESASQFICDVTSSTLSYARSKYEGFTDNRVFSPFCMVYSDAVFKSVFSMSAKNTMQEFCNDLTGRLTNATVGVLSNNAISKAFHLDEKSLKTPTKIFLKSLVKSSRSSNLQNNIISSVIAATASTGVKFFSSLKQSDLEDIVGHGMMGFFKDYSLRSSISSATKRAITKNIQKITMVKENYNSGNITLAGQGYFYSKEIASIVMELEKSYLPEVAEVLVLGSMLALNVYLGSQQNKLKSFKDKNLVKEVNKSLEESIKLKHEKLMLNFPNSEIYKSSKDNSITR